MIRQQTVSPKTMTMEVRQTNIRWGTIQIPLELTMPAPTTGWMILTQTSLDDPQHLDQVRGYCHHQGIATMVVYLGTPGAGVKPMTERLLAATRWLQDQVESKGLPVSYFGMGQQTGVALVAAADQAHLSAVISWNGQALPNWRTLRRVATPALLLVDEQSPWQTRWANRLAYWQMGSSSQFKMMPQADFATYSFEWLRSNSRSQARGRSQSMPLKRLLATGTLALALALPLAAPAIVQAAQAPAIVTAQVASEFDFADGFTLGANDVQGDGFSGLINQGNVNPGRREAKDQAKNSDGSYTLGANAVSGDGFTPRTGEISLVDAGGLEFFVNTNITFTTSSSASGAASEATFTQAVVASTETGGTTLTTLSDAFDGYNGLFVNGVSYNDNGLVALECLGTTSGIERQVVYNPQTIGNLTVSRKVFVPDNDEFIRWINVITNTGGAVEAVTVETSNNLGSDTLTVIDDSTNGNTTAEVSDTWVTTYQDYDSDGLSGDVRLGHVLQGVGVPVPMTAITMTNGLNTPSWAYTFNLNPGETVVLVNFATGQPSLAAAAAQSANLANLAGSALACLTPLEIARISNFDLGADVSVSQTDSEDPVTAGQPFNYTLQVDNAGSAEAVNVSLTDTLPAGVTYQNASGTGWTCNEAGGVVTCDLPSLVASGGSSVTIQLVAPNATSGTVITNSVTVEAANHDPNLTNNVSDETTTIFVPTDVTLTEFSAQKGGPVAAAALAILALPGLGLLIRRRRARG
jgi:uncharacterized repeat protein (TIGR01451 family)